MNESSCSPPLARCAAPALALAKLPPLPTTRPRPRPPKPRPRPPGATRSRLPAVPGAGQGGRALPADAPGKAGKDAKPRRGDAAVRRPAAPFACTPRRAAAARGRRRAFAAGHRRAPPSTKVARSRAAAGAGKKPSPGALAAGALASASEAAVGDGLAAQP